MLKKVMALSVSILLSAGFAGTTFAATNDDYNKTVEMIEKTNKDIEAKIAKAVGDSDNLEEQYIKDVQKIEEGDTIVNLKDQKKKLEDELGTTNDTKKFEKLRNDLNEVNGRLEEETTKVEKKIASIQAEIDSLLPELLSVDGNEKNKVDKKIAKLEEKLDRKVEKYTDRTAKFTKDLDRLINELYDTTLKMSNEAIKKAADKGIYAEAYWTQVELGGRLVWIDPIRVGC